MADSPSGPRPLLRTGGFALLGVGVIAAAAGVFTAATAGDGTGTAVPSASAQALPPSAPPSAGAVAEPAPPPPPPPPPPPAAVPTDPVVAAPAPAAPAEPDGAAAQPAPPVAAEPAPAAAAPGADGAAAVRVPLRVYNNSLIQGLAAQAKADFEAAGWTVTDVSGYGEGTVPASTVYFRPGTSEEAAAQELGREFGLRVEPRFPGIARSSGGVIVIVTADYKPGRTS